MLIFINEKINEKINQRIKKVNIKPILSCIQ